MKQILKKLDIEDIESIFNKTRDIDKFIDEYRELIIWINIKYPSFKHQIEKDYWIKRIIKEHDEILMDLRSMIKGEIKEPEYLLHNKEQVERMLKIEPITEEPLVRMNTYENLTTEELINQIRSLNQIQIYSVYEDWCVQLFDLSVCPNDIDVSCNWEGSGKDLKKVLIRALEYIVED